MNCKCTCDGASFPMNTVSLREMPEQIRARCPGIPPHDSSSCMAVCCGKSSSGECQIAPSDCFDVCGGQGGGCPQGPSPGPRPQPQPQPGPNPYPQPQPQPGPNPYPQPRPGPDFNPPNPQPNPNPQPGPSPNPNPQPSPAPKTAHSFFSSTAGKVTIGVSSLVILGLILFLLKMFVF